MCLNLISQQSSINLLEVFYGYFKKKMVGHDPPLTSWQQELVKIFQTLCDGGDRKIKKIIEDQIHYNYNICRHHGLLHLYDEAQDDHICKDLPQIAEVEYLFVLLYVCHSSNLIYFLANIIAFLDVIFSINVSLWHYFFYKPC